MNKRVTLNDIAKAAGLSKGAVSYAMNGKSGVSAETRERVMAIAGALDWKPSHAARSLSFSKADSIGLIIARPAQMLGSEPFYMEFIAGLEEVLASEKMSLTLHLVASKEQELVMWDKWSRSNQIDGAIIVDLEQDDERPAFLRQLGLPCVLVCGPDSSQSMTHVWSDDCQSMAEAVRYLFALGHRRIARVGGIKTLATTHGRDEAFRGAVSDLGLEEFEIVWTDFSGEKGASATRFFLSLASPPTAIIFDNDIMAVAGLGVASEMSVSVPGNLSLVAWDDSTLCQVTHPSLSAVQRDVSLLGATAARTLLALVRGEDASSEELPRPVMVPRGSTGPAPDPTAV